MIAKRNNISRGRCLHDGGQRKYMALVAGLHAGGHVSDTMNPRFGEGTEPGVWAARGAAGGIGEEGACRAQNLYCGLAVALSGSHCGV
jgi:hypothetical protein